MADDYAEARHLLKHYNSGALYLCIEARSTAMLTGFLLQVGYYLTPEEFVSFCNELALQSSTVLAQVHECEQ